MGEDMMPPSIGFLPCQNREPIKIRSHSGPGDEHPVLQLFQTMADHPGQHEMSWNVHGHLPLSFEKYSRPGT